MEIVNYTDKYKEEVRNICFNTASDEYKKYRDCLLYMYCDYYIEYEKDNCFIVLDNDKVCGYIICSSDFNNYKKVFKESIYKNVRNSSKKLALAAMYQYIEFKFMNKRGYGAHLHIDILKDYQKRGIGKELINTLISELKSKGTKGLYLCCGGDNYNAQGFYEHLGFYTKKKRKAGVLYRMEI